MINDDTELLKKIHRNCTDAADAASMLLPRTADAGMKRFLMGISRRYSDLGHEAYLRLQTMRALPEEGVFSHLGTWTAVTMSTITNKSAARIASTLSEAAEAGILEITHALNSASFSPHTEELARRLISLEDETLYSLRGWL